MLYALAAPLVAGLVILRGAPVSTMLNCAPSALKAGLLVLAIGLSYPLQSLALYYYTTSQSSERLLAEIQGMNLGMEPPAGALENPKNLVLIYLEGIEQNYLDQTIFPDLMPYLTSQRAQGLWFSNVQQFPGTEWTIGGIVGSQCGVPLLSDGGGNRVLSKADNPFRHVTCLAEYVKGVGYRTAFLGGASLEFAGKGNFLRDNGYEVALGLEELPNAAGHRWGMYDVDMFDHARALFDGLAEREGPFLLTLLTLDSHHPTGTPSLGCRAYADDPVLMLQAVHCTDQLLKGFLEHLRASDAAENTIVALVSDHLLIRGEVEDALEGKDRRLTFIVLDSDRPPQQFDGAATHFDIGPTLLELAGFADAGFAFGHSLVSHDIGRAFARNLTKRDFERFKIENLAAAAGSAAVGQ
jgi:phosphoglycerol transferase MdoB-like AlkP superfamily enzyme